MPQCAAQAVLIVTLSVDNTTTNIVRERFNLNCDLAAGHDGSHRDSSRGEQWDAEEGARPTIIRSEDE